MTEKQTEKITVSPKTEKEPITDHKAQIRWRHTAIRWTKCTVRPQGPAAVSESSHLPSYMNLPVSSLKKTPEDSSSI